MYSEASLTHATALAGAQKLRVSSVRAHEQKQEHLKQQCQPYRKTTETKHREHEQKARQEENRTSSRSNSRNVSNSNTIHRRKTRQNTKTNNENLPRKKPAAAAAAAARAVQVVAIAAQAAAAVQVATALVNIDGCRHTMGREELVEITLACRLAEAGGTEEVLVEGHEVWKEWIGQPVGDTDWGDRAKEYEEQCSRSLNHHQL